GCGATLIDPYEPLDRAPAILTRNARTVIGHRQQDAVALAACADQDLGVSPVDRRRLGVFDRIVDEIGHGLADELAIALHGRRARCVDLDRQALYIGERLREPPHTANTPA